MADQTQKPGRTPAYVIPEGHKYYDYFRYPYRYAIDPFKIIGNVYFVGDKFAGLHLIDTGEGYILLDSGFPHAKHLYLTSIWKMGIDPRDIQYIFHSHGHTDHIGLTREMVELFGCKTALGINDLETLQEEPPAEVMRAEAFEPDILLKDGDKFSLGNTTIRAVTIPGHSPGCMAYFFDTEAEGQVYHVGVYGGMGYGELSKKNMALSKLLASLICSS